MFFSGELDGMCQGNSYLRSIRFPTCLQFVKTKPGVSTRLFCVFYVSSQSCFSFWELCCVPNPILAISIHPFRLLSQRLKCGNGA